MSGVVFRVGDRVVSNDPARFRFTVIDVETGADGQQALRAADDAFEIGWSGPPFWFDAHWFDLEAPAPAEQRSLFG